MENKRIARLRENVMSSNPSIDVVRARLMTQAYKENATDPLCIRMGKALYKILDEMPICIDDGELIVGRPTLKPRAALLFPEVQSGWMSAELKNVRTRPIDPLDITDEAIEEIERDILPFWKGKTINEQVFGNLPEETKNLLYKDPNVYPAASAMLIDNFSLLEKGIGTCVPNYEKILTRGINDILAEIDERISDLKLEDPAAVEKYNFYRAAQYSLKALVRFAERHSELAKELAAQTDDEQRKAELLEISRICAKVPAEKPESLHEALQCWWFIHLMIRMEASGHSLSPGRFDQYIYPFYEMDKTENKDEWALLLLECLFIKLSEMMLFAGSNASKTHSGVPQWQNLNIGGRKADGTDATNRISYLCLQAQADLKLVQPDLSARIHSDTPEDFLIECCRLSRLGTGHPKYFNEDLISFSMGTKGISIEDARNFSIMGCVEPRVTGKEGVHLTGGWINLPGCLEITMYNGYWNSLQRKIGLESGDPRDFKTFDEFMDAYKKQLANLVKHLFVINAFAEVAYVQTISMPFLSCLTYGCLEEGKDIQHGGAFYNFGPAVNQIGIAETGDSLMVIKKLVFEEKKVTMDRLIKAMEDNFENDPELSDMIANGVEKYGNGCDEVDYLLNDVIMYVNDEIMKQRNIFGGVAQSGIIPTTSGIPFGRAVGALPCGHKAHTPFTDSCSPVPGNEKYGPTVSLQSISRIDAAKLRNGVLLNMRINPDLVQDEVGLHRFADLIRVCCDLKIWHIQFNMVHTETLLDAKVHPENYRDLLVRVAGYSAYFTRLNEDVQDDIIARVEHDI